MFSSNDKRAMNQGFGDGMSRAFELVATPFVFAGIGFLVDAVVGTSPVFLVAFGLFGLVGTFLRAWYGYDAEMRTHEASGRWNRSGEHEAARPDDHDTTDIWSVERGVRS